MVENDDAVESNATGVLTRARVFLLFGTAPFALALSRLVANRGVRKVWEKTKYAIPESGKAELH